MDDVTTAGPPWLQLVGYLVGLAGVVIGAWLAYRGKSKETKADTAQALLDQYQEDRRDDDKRIKQLEARLDEMERKDNVLRTYVWQLIAHINQKLPPPPPAWPQELI